jgi:SAM-dependent methyltransferase
MYEAMYIIEKEHWWYKTKRDIVLMLINAIALTKESSIVDFGCGTGVILASLEEYQNLTGIDFSPIAIDFCRKRFTGRLIQASLSDDLKLDYKYDIGVALDVVEHLQDDFKALINMKNTLQPKGTLILTVPAFKSLWTKHDDNCHHFRRYTLNGLKEIVQRAGFKVEYISYYNFILFLPIVILRLISKLLPLNRDSEFENKIPHKLINTILYRVFRCEMFFIKRRIRFPFGISLIAVLKKPLT